MSESTAGKQTEPGPKPDKPASQPPALAAAPETAASGVGMLPGTAGGVTAPPVLPGHPSRQLRDLAAQHVIGLQRWHGNRWATRLLELSRAERADASPVAARTIQRDPPPAVDAGAGGHRDAEGPSGVPGPAPGPAPAPARPTFTFDQFIRSSIRFDSQYTPVGPLPAVGELTITLKAHITFAPFTRAMMRQEPFRSHRFTREQRADFAWTDAEKETFARGFISSVHDAWSEKHTMHLADPTFAEYRSRVVVNVTQVPDPGSAHTRITAQKVPRGAPRFRSFVSGNTATLDSRDPTEPETQPDRSLDYVRQVGPFAFNSAALTPLESQIAQIETDLRRIVPRGPDGNPLEDWVVFYTGRASARGNRAHNERLGRDRARAIETRINADLGWRDLGQGRSSGAEHAADDAQFQRVDVQVLNMGANRSNVTQNTAAHEAGHMFGLGDEYVDETPPTGSVPKFLGDRPSHYGDVEAHLGTDAANETLVQDSGSIMAEGGQVNRGHYVYFLEALNQMTSKTWTVE